MSGPLYPLPADTQVAGAGNPPGDVNKIVDVFNHSALQRVFYVDQYGADPTGASLSDTAFTNAYSAAAAAVQAHGGAMIAYGPGYYQHSVNTVATTDSRIGIRGAGRQATNLFTTGNTGTLLKATSATGPSPQGSAPVTGLTCYGVPAGAGVTGIQYGDRYGGTLTDVSSTGFGGAGSMGFHFYDSTGLSEGSFIAVMADQNADDFVFEGSGIGGTGSFDYCNIFLHVTASTAGGQSGTAMKVINGMQLNGTLLRLAGNASATTGLTKTVLQVGASTSDTAYMQACTLIVNVEADTSVGTVYDVVLQGTSANTGIIHCNGTMMFQSTSGTYSIGSVSGSSVFTTAGFLHGPLFSGHGTLTAVGTGGAFSTYSG